MPGAKVFQRFSNLSGGRAIRSIFTNLETTTMTSPLFDLTGKVALITGGSKGLGKAMARGFAEAGADIVISSRHQEELEPALTEILAGTKSKGRWFVADMTDRAAVDGLARDVLNSMGKVDILVNNAGSNIPQAVDAIEDDKWDRIIELKIGRAHV